MAVLRTVSVTRGQWRVRKYISPANLISAGLRVCDCSDLSSQSYSYYLPSLQIISIIIPIIPIIHLINYIFVVLWRVTLLYRSSVWRGVSYKKFENYSIPPPPSCLQYNGGNVSKVSVFYQSKDLPGPASRWMLPFTEVSVSNCDLTSGRERTG